MKELIIEYCHNESDFNDFQNDIYYLKKFVKDKILSPNQKVENGDYFSFGESFGIISFPNSNSTCFVFRSYEILKYYYRLSNYNIKTTRKAIEFLREVVAIYNQGSMREKIIISNKKEIIDIKKKNIEKFFPDNIYENFVTSQDLTKWKNDGIKLLNFTSCLSSLLYSVNHRDKLYKDNINKSKFPIILFTSNHILTDFKIEEVNNIFSNLLYILVMIYNEGKKVNFNPFESIGCKIATNLLSEMNYQLIQQVDRERMIYRQKLINEILSKYNIPK